MSKNDWRRGEGGKRGIRGKSANELKEVPPARRARGEERNAGSESKNSPPILFPSACNNNVLFLATPAPSAAAVALLPSSMPIPSKMRLSSLMPLPLPFFARLRPPSSAWARGAGFPASRTATARFLE